MSLAQNLPLALMQTQWSSQLNPLLQIPMLQGVAISNLVLKTGANQINHLLQRKPQGWFVTDINASATIYRSQPFNSNTLTLTSSAPVTVSLWVY